MSDSEVEMIEPVVAASASESVSHEGSPRASPPTPPLTPKKKTSIAGSNKRKSTESPGFSSRKKTATTVKSPRKKGPNTDDDGSACDTSGEDEKERDNTAVARQQAPLASAWSQEHVEDLNFAILKVALDHSAELYNVCPSLTPWRIKGRLLNKVRSMMTVAPGGQAAIKRWDAEEKPIRSKGGSKINKAKKDQ
ncbi:hypothetical protein BCV70DRAFT_216279 [Testicularia cyperi]|uniref:Uncharacterized protein n=1 Tax=Testicularia cyperi TaxID=1882483 RepID=A0A317XRR9_9BASI|nr:hypothetical protein BCV70DRAFT_216279 [Testicularia cyperi]